MELCQQVLAITTTGGAGVSTGTAFFKGFMGYVEDIYLDYNASAPATTDVVISHEDSKYGTIYAKADSVTDVLVAPRVKPVDNAGAAITNAYDKFPVLGRIKVVVAQSDDLAPALTVYLRYWRVG